MHARSLTGLICPVFFILREDTRVFCCNYIQALYFLVALLLYSISHFFLSLYVSLSPSIADLRKNLQTFVEETNQRRPDFIKMVRHTKQEGLIRSRVSGWRAASAPVVALFDAHVEFNVGW